jgi:HEAT repeat protein
MTDYANLLARRDPDVRAAAATALGGLGDQVSSVGFLRRVARGLWWRLTATGDIPEAACGALGQVVARLTELEVAGLAWEDTGSGHSRSTRLLRRGGTNRVQTLSD